MSPGYRSCIVCGMIIFDRHRGYPEPWLAQYRVVYSEGGKAKITGVGFLEDSSSAVCNPPRDSSKRWDDGYGTIELTLNSFKFGVILHGYILHSSCWQILLEACKPRDVDLHRLVEACDSLPYPTPMWNGAYWGHFYGGLWAWNHRKYFPWQEQHLIAGSENIHDYSKQDPYNVPKAWEILSSEISPPFTKPLLKRSGDCFTSLPQEVLDIILLYLPTKDALNLRLASASFLYILTSAFFWASRFSAAGERGFIFERKKHSGYLDWLRMYKLSGSVCLDAPLLNRRRVWFLARTIADIIRRPLGENPPNMEGSDLRLPEMSWTACEIWTEAKRQRSSECFYSGCKSFGLATVAVPSDLAKIGVTKVEVGEMTYITGIRLITKNSVATKLGYVLEQEEKIFKVDGFQGFRIALSPSGIRALRIFQKANLLSSWAGNPTSMLICNNVIRVEPVQQLAASFDGFKLVRLGINGTSNVLPKVDTDTLLRRSLWYPDTPPEVAYLKSESDFVSRLANENFLPIISLDFGGPKGQYLSKVTGISCHFDIDLKCIEVHFETTSNGPSSKRIGHYDPSSASAGPSNSWKIDGASGEYITALEIATKEPDSSSMPSSVKGLKLWTNYGEIHEIGSFDVNNTVQQLVAPESAAITGFFSNEVSFVQLLNPSQTSLTHDNGKSSIVFPA